MRKFPTGATRDDDRKKPKLRGYFSPLVIQRFGKYMQEHEVQADGVSRPAGNWKKGMPLEEYFESLLRHVLDVWLHLDGSAEAARGDLEEALCGVFFNTQGCLHEVLKAKGGEK